jgi:exopolysaccharide biosynthesis polyprenyl glycosylphosphotransferase
MGTQELKMRTTEGEKELYRPPFPAAVLGDAHGLMDHRRIHRFLFLVDLCLIWMGAAAAHEISLLCARTFHYAAPQELSQAKTTGCLLLFSVLIVVFAQLQREYASLWKRSLHEELRFLAKSIASAVFVTGACIHLFTISIENKVSVALTIVFSGAFLAAWRKLLRSQSIEGLSERRNILIVGCGPNGKLLRNHVEGNPELGYVFKGYVDRRLTGKPPNPARNIEEAHILGPADQLESIVRTHFIDEVFVTVPGDRHLVKLVARNARRAGALVRVIPDLYDGLAIGQPVEYIGQFPTLTLHHRAIPTFQLILKRLADIAISALTLILLAPFLLFIAVIVKLDSNGPVLYESFRVGKKGKTFLCHKFRTMVHNADALKESLKHLNERDGITFKISEDPRITRVGRFLRKYSLDELPQLWNVFLGDLSLVGPRPHPPDDFSRYALEHRRRLEVAPGITGLWQVTARGDPSFEKNVTLDIEYIQNWSLWLDLQILWKTVGVVFAGTGQ